MSPISRGFRGRRTPSRSGRIPPGQYLTSRLSGALGRADAAHADRRVELRDRRRGREPAWTWEEFRALPSETLTVDIHCVTKWSKLDTSWRGVSVDTLLDGVETEAEYVTAWSDGGYTTNVPLEDVTGGQAGSCTSSAASRSSPSTAGRRGCSCPHLYFWKSAKWVRGLTLTVRRRARLLGGLRLPQPRRPMAGAALPGRLSPARRSLAAWRRSSSFAREDPHVTAIALDVPGWPGHIAGQHVDVRLTAEDGYQTERSLLDRLGARGREARADGRAHRGRRGLAVPDHELRAGDELELRGPIGGYFIWREQTGPVAADRRRLRPRAADGDAPAPRRNSSTVEARLLLSARSLSDTLYRDELEALAAAGRLALHYTFTRISPRGWDGFARRVDAEMLSVIGPPPDRRPKIFVCGPTAFVERAAEALVELGHEPAAVRTERFGPTG